MLIYSKTTIAKNELNDILKSFIKCPDDDSFNVAMQLIKMGANPNTQNDEGNTILFTATSGNDLDTIKKFVELGCDINIKNNQGNDVMSIPLVCSKQFDIIKYFLENGYDATTFNKSPTKLNESSLFVDNFYSDNEKILIINLFIKHGLLLTDRDYYGQTLADMIMTKKQEGTEFGKFILTETEKVENAMIEKNYIHALEYLHQHHLKEPNNDYNMNINYCYNSIKRYKQMVNVTDSTGNIIFYYLKTVEDTEKFVVLLDNDAILQWYNDKTKKNLIDMAIEYGNEKLLRWYIKHMVGHIFQPEVVKILNENNIELSKDELKDLEEYVPELYILLNYVHDYIKNICGKTNIVIDNYKKHLRLNFGLMTKNKNVPEKIIESYCEYLHDETMVNKILMKILYHFVKIYQSPGYIQQFIKLFAPKIKK